MWDTVLAKFDLLIDRGPIFLNIDKNKYTRVFSQVPKEAIHGVDHKILWLKVRKYGVLHNAVKWFSDYLKIDNNILINLVIPHYNYYNTVYITQVLK